MQGYGVFSFARYYGNSEIDFPIKYGPAEYVDKLEGDLLLPAGAAVAALSAKTTMIDGLHSTSNQENPAAHTSFDQMSHALESNGTDKATTAIAGSKQSASGVAINKSMATSAAKRAKRASKVFSKFLYR